MLREIDPRTTLWELLLLEEAKRLPAELQAVDAYLDDERLIAPWRALFDRRLGRASVPVDTLLRLRFRRLRNWRVGIEARISHLKRAFGVRRTRLRRLGGARIWGLGDVHLAGARWCGGRRAAWPSPCRVACSPTKRNDQFHHCR